jgi:hypothetical protein
MSLKLMCWAALLTPDTNAELAERIRTEPAAVRYASKFGTAAAQRKYRITDSVLRTLGYLATHGESAWPGASTIAKKRGIAKATVKKHLDALESAGLITRGSQAAVDHLPPNRRPIVWEFPVFGGTAVHPKGPVRGIQRDGSGGYHEQNAPYIEEGTEERTPVVISEAYAGLGGGIGSTPSKRFPKQCDKHQATFNTDKCVGCGETRVFVEAREIQDRRAARTDEGHRRAREAAQAIADCAMCDDTGRLPGFAVCQHVPSVGMSDEQRALAFGRHVA